MTLRHMGVRAMTLENEEFERYHSRKYKEH